MVNFRNDVTDKPNELDAFWLLFGGVLVLLMQLGFGFLKLGGIRVAHTKVTSMKTVFDMSLSGICWWLVGWGIAYGDDANQIVGDTEYATKYTKNYAMWFFSWAFSIVSLTVISGAVGDRFNVRCYLLFSIIYTLFIYPFIVHWAWGDGWASPFRSNIREELLGGCGVLDYAGSGVVHMTGGMASLIIAKMLGPRVGRFTSGALDYNSIYQSVGTILLWVGWYGFNGVSSYAITGGVQTYVARTFATTTISAAMGSITATFLGVMKNGYISTSLANYGALSGLVAIGAGAATCELEGALVIGIVAGIIYYFGSQMISYVEIDDVVDAIPVHFLNGAWGLIAAALFTTKEYYADVYTNNYMNGHSRAEVCAGAFYGGKGYLLASNICFVFTILAWCGCITFIFLFVLDMIMNIRDKKIDEEDMKRVPETKEVNP